MNGRDLITFPSPIILMRILLRTGANTMSTSTSIHKGIKRSTYVCLTASRVDKARSMDMDLSATRVPRLAQEIKAIKVGQ